MTSRSRMRITLRVSALALIAGSLDAQDPARAGELEFGPTLSVRMGGGVLHSAGVTASIRSVDSTLRFDPTSHREVLAGVAMTTRPFSAVPNLGITANVQVLSSARGWAFGEEGVEGGVGFNYRLAPQVAFGVLVEIYQQRQPRRWVLELDGQQLPSLDGGVVTQIDPSDERYFVSASHRQLTMVFSFYRRQ